MNSNKRIDQLFDLSKLSESSLRKYQSYFRIQCQDSELKGRVQQHFNNDLKVDSNQVIDKLLDLKREEKGGKIRGMRPIRKDNI